jgi:glycosyltransferase involved in cell wall biosynthesis
LRHEISQRGIRAERVTVIPNAVDTRDFRFESMPDAALRTRLGLDGATVVGFAGSFYAYEGLDLLLDAAETLVTRHPTCAFSSSAEGRRRRR